MAQVLVIGSGGREHALAIALARSGSVACVHVAPIATPHPKIKALETALPTEHAAIVQWCRHHKIDLVVVGPEQPLAEGLADTVLAAGIACFGPSRAAAELESSKAYAKAFMARHGIPTARFQVFTAEQAEEACNFIATATFPARVVKASGLAAGKGVVVASSVTEAQAAVRLAAGGAFGPDAGKELVVEELLTGPEVSVLAFCDGQQAVLMPAAQDHKRLADGDAGPNTGGMGAYAPCFLLDAAAQATVQRTVFEPVMKHMAAEGRPYHGVLYAGLMLTPAGPRVLEFNCRFGDPETQALVALMEGDLYQTMLSCVPGHTGHLQEHASRLFAKDKFAVNVVLASGGYPEKYNKGVVIHGLNAEQQLDGHPQVQIFHAGTALNNKQLVTAGGRVLGVCGVSSSLRGAVEITYRAAHNIHFVGMQMRRDIAYQALAEQAPDGLTYRSAGVDIDAGDALVDAIKPYAKRTSRTGCNAELGGYGGVFDLRDAGFHDPVLISGTDGVGTKLKVAIAANIHDTVGIDLVAMSVNDILTRGAEPLFFLDYLATSKLTVSQLADVVKGVAEGCVQAHCALMGGETAEMPGMYHPGDYDVAGFAVGAVERKNILPRIHDIRAGDVVLGLASSGVHSNGFSLVRRIVEASGLQYSDPCPFDDTQSLGAALLTPTIIYVRQLMPLIRSGMVKALAHITGSGMPGNIPRVLPADLTAELDASTWKILDVYKWMAAVGRVAPDEMARTFNLGLGMVVVVAEEEAGYAEELLRESGAVVYRVGKLVPKPNALADQVVIHNLPAALRDDRFLPPPRPVRKRVAVLISGTGTNLQALIDAAAKPDYPAEIVLVVSNKPDVKGLERAKNANIPAVVVPHEKYSSREAFEAAVHEELERANAEIVCLAGFMRILTPWFVSRWRGRLLNTHPALLPAFKGAHAHKLALEAGVTVSGCTVHFVEAEVDAGAIVVQRAVPVLPDDTEDSLSERVKTAEHVAFPEALRLVSSGKCILGPDGKAIRS